MTLHEHQTVDDVYRAFSGRFGDCRIDEYDHGTYLVFERLPDESWGLRNVDLPAGVRIASIEPGVDGAALAVELEAANDYADDIADRISESTAARGVDQWAVDLGYSAAGWAERTGRDRSTVARNVRRAQTDDHKSDQTCYHGEVFRHE